MENKTSKNLARLDLVRRQLSSNKCLNLKYSSQKSDDDVVVISALRTPMCRANKGSLKDTNTEILIETVLKETLKRNKLDPKLVQEIVFGNVMLPGAALYQSRMAQFLADFPDTTTLMTVNRLCSSGLQAVMDVVNQINSHQIDIGIGGGVESMSQSSMNDGINPEKLSDSIFENEGARNCLIPMGLTSENVVEKYGLKREDLDRFSVESHLKAAKSQKEGWSSDEIVPVKTILKDKDGNAKDVVVSLDDGIRKDANYEMLLKLKPAFKKDGITTAGNSSQVTDGAAAVLVCRRSKAKELGLTPIARFISYAVAGCPPELMGIGPAIAIPKALTQCGLEIKDIDVFEINEAFASQATYCIDHLKIPKEKVNPRGGAIALGHPLGMTGARQFATLLSELKRTDKKMGVISMCIGTGMGACAVLERE